MSRSDISLAKATYIIFGLNTIRVTTDATSEIDPATSHIQTQTQFITLISCEIEPVFNMPTYQKIVVWADLNPYLFKLDSSDAVDEYGLSKLPSQPPKNKIPKPKKSQL